MQNNRGPPFLNESFFPIRPNSPIFWLHSIVQRVLSQLVPGGDNSSLIYYLIGYMFGVFYVMMPIAERNAFRRQRTHGAGDSASDQAPQEPPTTGVDGDGEGGDDEEDEELRAQIDDVD